MIGVIEMNKDIITDILLQIWGAVDQAQMSDCIEKAYKNCPVKIQKELIKDMVDFLECHKETSNFAYRNMDEVEEMINIARKAIT